MKAVILVGCSASGKSTLVKQFPASFIQLERDKARETVVNQKFPLLDMSKENLWAHWNWKLEKEVTEIINSRLEYAHVTQSDIIISDTNLNKDKRDALIAKLTGLGYEVEVQVVGKELTLDQLWKRDNLRKNSVGHHVIAEQYSVFRKEFPLYELKDVQVLYKPQAVIFDVDGTLAHMEGVRGAFDWDKVDLDAPDPVVFSSLIAQQLMGYSIIVMSGRDGVCRDKTVDWLNKWYNHYRKDMFEIYRNNPDFFGKHNVFMRPEGSMESDVKVKRDLFMQHVDGKYNVICVFDDRPKVCRGWYDLGLKVIHCGNPYVEF